VTSAHTGEKSQLGIWLCCMSVCTCSSKAAALGLGGGLVRLDVLVERLIDLAQVFFTQRTHCRLQAQLADEVVILGLVQIAAC